MDDFSMNANIHDELCRTTKIAVRLQARSMTARDFKYSIMCAVIDRAYSCGLSRWYYFRTGASDTLTRSSALARTAKPCGA